MNKLARFIKYNNTIPIIMGALFLSFGGALAASPDVRDAVYEETSTVQSIDNTYIANKELASYTPTVRITGVTEDTENYYVSYTFATIDVVDYVWRDISEERAIAVAKAALAGRDLGLYVTEQLKQVIDREIAYLKEVQEIERRQVSQKTVATQYSGLVGALIDDRTEVFPEYTPVVAEQAQQQTGQTEQATDSGPQTVNGQVAGDSTSTQTPSSGSSAVSQGSDTTPPTIQILGNNPARIPVGSTYNDLGAVVTDNVNDNLGVRKTVDGRSVFEVQVDTGIEGTHVVRYTTSDQAGNEAYAERIVEVYFDPSLPRPQTGTPPPAPSPEPAPAT